MNWRAGLGRFGRDERGNMAILFSTAATFLMMFCAFAIDEASLYLERRQAQSAVDLAAITAARDPARAFAMARTVLLDAGVIKPTDTAESLSDPASQTRLTVQAGAYSADPNLRPGARFVTGSGGVNAVRVHFVKKGTVFFGQMWSDGPSMTVESLASATPQVSFSVGSRLLSLQEGLGNLVLNRLLGANVSLSAVSYDGILNARVGLFRFLDELAQELNVTAGTYDQLLTQKADHGVLAKALAESLTGAERTAAMALAIALGENGQVPLNKLFDLGDLGRLQVGSEGGNLISMAKLSAMELLTASAALSDGTHQVALNLGANVPGLTSLAVKLAVGEPPQNATWFGIGPSGTLVRTAQVRLKLTANLLGGPVLLGAGVKVPLYLEIAAADASVISATCPAGNNSNGSAVIGVKPAVARLILGEVSDASLGNFSAPPQVFQAKLIDLLLLRVRGSAMAEIASPNVVPLSFSPADVSAGTLKSGKTTQMVTGLTRSLTQNLQLQIDVLGLGLAPVSLIDASVRALISPLAPVLDVTIDKLLEALGLKLGEADVRVYSVTCSVPVLVG